MRTTRPYQSADGRATYVNDEHGTRHRVHVSEDGQQAFDVRRGKAAKKAIKRANAKIMKQGGLRR